MKKQIIFGFVTFLAIQFLLCGYIIQGRRDEAGYSGPVVLTGTPTFVTDSDHGIDGSESVTIPSDCDTVVVIWSQWKSSTAMEFDELNFDDGSDIDFDLIFSASGADAIYDMEARVMTSTDTDWPGTGAKTLYWSLDAAPVEGGSVTIFYLKGVDQSTPIRDSDYQRGGTSDWTSTLTSVDANDLSFIMVADYYTRTIDGTPTGEGQTTLTSGSNDNSSDWEIGYEQGEASMNATTSQGNNTAYGAFAMKVAP